jgi:hypothetical protein
MKEILTNADDEFITEWFWWTPFLLMFGTPIVGGLIEGGPWFALLMAMPFITLLLIQKYMPI